MEGVEIPDDFYIYDRYFSTYLCHKSCVLKNDIFSNRKYIYSCMKPFTNESIAILRHKCDTIDEIEEKTYFVDNTYSDDNTFNKLVYDARSNENVWLEGMCIYKKFNSVNDFINYLAKNYLKSVKSTDIKIALKD
jgi:hypothetical protein